MSSSRNMAAMASLPHTRFDGALGTGRSISLLAAAAGLADAISIFPPLDSGASAAELRRIPPERTRAMVAQHAERLLEASQPAPLAFNPMSADCIRSLRSRRRDRPQAAGVLSSALDTMEEPAAN